MRSFKEIIEEMYQRYNEITAKDEKMETVKKAAEILGFGDKELNLRFDEKFEKATAKIYLDKWDYGILYEVMSWVEADYKVNTIYVYITTEAIKKESSLESKIEKRANAVGLEYITTKTKDFYYDYFRLPIDLNNIYVYLIVENEN